MKKLLVFCAALLALTVSVSHAQVDLSWNNCVIIDTDAGDGAAPASNTTFVCTGTTTSQKKLFGSYKVPVSIPDFFAMDISIDLGNQTGPMASNTFWHYQAGGCNAAGLVLSDDKTTPGTTCNAMSTAWGDFGEASDAFVTAYGVGFGGPNKSRLLLSIARSAADPFPLVAGTNYFGYQLTFVTNTANRACIGCTNQVAIVWNSATLFRLSGPTTVLTGPDKGSTCGTVANASQTTCDATPVQNTTWGQLKAIYR